MADIPDFELMKAIFERRRDLNVVINEQTREISLSESGNNEVTFDFNSQGELHDLRITAD